MPDVEFLCGSSGLIKYQNNALVIGLVRILILQGRLNWLMDDVYDTDYTCSTKN